MLGVGHPGMLQVVFTTSSAWVINDCATLYSCLCGGLLDDPAVVASYPRVSRIIGQSVPWASLVELATKRMKNIRCGNAFNAPRVIPSPDMSYTDAEVSAIWKRAFQGYGEQMPNMSVDMQAGIRISK